MPFAVVALAGDALPVPPALGFYPVPLLTSAAYGLLIALAFALWPLARARTLPAARLFRDAVESRGRPGWATVLLTAAAALAIVALALAQSSDPLFAGAFIGGALALLLGLGLLAAAIRALAARAPRPRRECSRASRSPISTAPAR